MLLELRNVRVHYEWVEALKGVSMSVEEGEVVTLIGANGAGKSTTMRAISGTKSLTAGEVWYQGHRVDGQPPQRIVAMGIAQVPEGRRVFPFMTVLENLQLGAYTRNDRKQINADLDEIYTHFPVLKDRRRQAAGSLSGGEQQMVAIGRALMSKPKLLLMDEPTLGLSPLLVQETGRIIQHINSLGVSIMLVEQNARMALKLARRGYVLETGNVVLEGQCQELLANEQVKRAYLGG